MAPFVRLEGVIVEPLTRSGRKYPTTSRIGKSVPS